MSDIIWEFEGIVGNLKRSHVITFNVREKKYLNNNQVIIDTRL